MASRRRRTRRPRPAASPPTLQYKVVELSSVDEVALEATVNEWVGRGWAFDGVQFAMRESSKRPAMAFVFFTRAGPPAVARTAPRPSPVDEGAELNPAPASVQDAWQRLRALAQDDGADDE